MCCVHKFVVSAFLAMAMAIFALVFIWNLDWFIAFTSRHVAALGRHHPATQAEVQRATSPLARSPGPM